MVIVVGSHNSFIYSVAVELPIVMDHYSTLDLLLFSLLGNWLMTLMEMLFSIGLFSLEQYSNLPNL